MTNCRAAVLFHPKECKPPGKGGWTRGLSLLSLRFLVCLARVALR